MSAHLYSGFIISNNKVSSTHQNNHHRSTYVINYNNSWDGGGGLPQFKLLKVGKISPGKVTLKPLVCTARVLILTQDLLSIYIAVTFAKCFIIILLAVSSPKQPMENFTEEEPGPREEPKKPSLPWRK